MGSLSASITWNPGTVEYTGNAGLLNGFSGNTDTVDVENGMLKLNIENSSGKAGMFAVIDLLFKIIGEPGEVTDFDISVSEITSAVSQVDLLNLVVYNKVLLVVPTRGLIPH